MQQASGTLEALVTPASTIVSHKLIKLVLI